MAGVAQCDSCGENNPLGSAFCLACGVYLGWDEKGSPAAAPGPTTSATAAAQATATSATGPVSPAPGSSPPPPAVSPESVPTVQPSPPDPRRPCPSCGQLNDPGRRFCGRCGYALVAPVAVPRPTRSAGPPPEQGGGWRWWGGDAAERAARRAYRQSLPPLYRWRRVLVAVGLLGLLGALAFVLPGHPIDRAKDAWRRWTSEPLAVPELRAEADPPDSVALTYAATSAVDGDFVNAWATAWPEGTTPTGDGDCAGAAGVGGLVLSWDQPVEIDSLRIRAGLNKDVADPAVAQPKTLALLAEGECARVTLSRGSDWQTVPVDLPVETSSVRLLVADVFKPRGGATANLVAISEVRVRTYSLE